MTGVCTGVDPQGWHAQTLEQSGGQDTKAAASPICVMFCSLSFLNMGEEET